MSATPHNSATTDAGGFDDIRPFRIEVPQDAIDDLGHRLAATRWPERETVDDESQGVQLATVEAVARHWMTHDWRDVEARLNALPQFLTDDRRARHPLHPCALEANPTRCR